MGTRHSLWEHMQFLFIEERHGNRGNSGIIGRGTAINHDLQLVHEGVAFTRLFDRVAFDSLGNKHFNDWAIEDALEGVRVTTSGSDAKCLLYDSIVLKRGEIATLGDVVIVPGLDKIVGACVIVPQAKRDNHIPWLACALPNLDIRFTLNEQIIAVLGSQRLFALSFGMRQLKIGSLHPRPSVLTLNPFHELFEGPKACSITDLFVPADAAVQLSLVEPVLNGPPEDVAVPEGNRRIVRRDNGDVEKAVGNFLPVANLAAAWRNVGHLILVGNLDFHVFEGTLFWWVTKAACLSSFPILGRLIKPRHSLPCSACSSRQ